MKSRNSNERLVSVRVSQYQMIVKFLNESISTSSNDDQPWKMIEETFDWCRLDTLRLDFGNVKYLSSIALGKVVTLNRKFKGRLEVVNLTDKILEVFAVTGIDRIVDIKAGSDSVAA